MTSFNLNIAGIPIRLQAAFPLEMTDNYAPFLVDGDQPPLEDLSLSVADAFPQMPEPQQWVHGTGITSLDGHDVRLYRLGDTLPPYLMEEIKSDTRRDLFYLRSSSEQPANLKNVFNNVGLEMILQRHDAMLLHSAFIRWEGKGILFSAPSGTGKSTQADLWGRYMGSETLNGDRSGLRKINGVWTAHGLPYAGSSGIYRNESAPIAAIVMLSQAPENRIERLSPAQCLRRILPEVSLHRWDPDFMNWGLDRLTELLCAVPCYHLSCRPDRGAVELLHDTITREV